MNNNDIKLTKLKIKCFDKFIYYIFSTMGNTYE